MPERWILRGWNTTSPSDRITRQPERAAGARRRRARAGRAGRRTDSRAGTNDICSRSRGRRRARRGSAAARRGSRRSRARRAAPRRWPSSDRAAAAPKACSRCAREVGAEAIVVEQRVVDVEQEHDRRIGSLSTGGVSSGVGSCQPSSPATTARAAAGPQVPGSYTATRRRVIDEDRIDDAPRRLDARRRA